MSAGTINERSLAVSVVERIQARPEVFDRSLVLRELMAHAVAALVILEGKRVAAEIAYQLADATVDCDHIV